MDRFVKRENIERYRKLASELTNDAERIQILRSLAEEVARFRLELRADLAMVPAADSF